MERGDLPLERQLWSPEDGRWQLRRWMVPWEMRDGVLWLPVEEKALWLEQWLRGRLTFLERLSTVPDRLLTEWEVEFVMLPEWHLWWLK